MSGDIDSLYRCRWNHQYQKKTFFWGGTYGWTYGGMYGQGGGGIICHKSIYHLSSFSTVQWDLGLGVRILFLGDEVLGQHGMTSWLPM